MSEIYLYDSLSNKKRKFEPIDQNHIRIYACGPTVYNYAHIGNARMAVVFDSFVRLLKNKYSNVTYVSNITDIDDKIIEAANEIRAPSHHLDSSSRWPVCDWADDSELVPVSRLLLCAQL